MQSEEIKGVRKFEWGRIRGCIKEAEMESG
jgi:hypothetical protein